MRAVNQPSQHQCIIGEAIEHDMLVERTLNKPRVKLTDIGIIWEWPPAKMRIVRQQPDRSFDSLDEAFSDLDAGLFGISRGPQIHVGIPPGGELDAQTHFTLPERRRVLS